MEKINLRWFPKNRIPKNYIKVSKWDDSKSKRVNFTLFDYILCTKKGN